MNRREIGEVFELRDNQISTLPYRSFRAGIQGERLEASLQSLIEKNPEVIPGSQIEPGADAPPSFLTLGKELSMHGQALDLLLVDQRGILTLVECKLMENTQARREVVGQIMDYAANVAEVWGGGRLRESASRYWGENTDDVVSEFAGDELDADEFWAQAEENLEEGRMRLIIAADRLRPEARRIIEFLNTNLQKVELLGLEISCYGDNEASMILVPRIVGQTQVTATKTGQRRQGRVWRYDDLTEYYESLDPELGGRLSALLDWASEAGVLMEVEAQNPIFGIKGRHGSRILTVWARGGVYCFMRASIFGGSEEKRDEFISELNTLPMFNYDVRGVISGRNSEGSVDELTDSDFARFLEILERYCVRS